jgi:hypothetical protein
MDSSCECEIELLLPEYGPAMRGTRTVYPEHMKYTCSGCDASHTFTWTGLSGPLGACSERYREGGTDMCQDGSNLCQASVGRFDGVCWSHRPTDQRPPHLPEAEAEAEADAEAEAEAEAESEAEAEAEAEAEERERRTEREWRPCESESESESESEAGAIANQHQPPNVKLVVSYEPSHPLWRA